MLAKVSLFLSGIVRSCNVMFCFCEEGCSSMHFLALRVAANDALYGLTQEHRIPCQ